MLRSLPIPKGFDHNAPYCHYIKAEGTELPAFLQKFIKAEHTTLVEELKARQHLSAFFEQEAAQFPGLPKASAFDEGQKQRFYTPSSKVGSDKSLKTPSLLSAIGSRT